MIGIAKDQRVIVSLGGKRARGVIREVYFRSYLVKLDGEEAAERFSAAKVRPETVRKPTAKLEPIAAPPQRTARQWAQEELERILPRPVPKPDLPEECPAWLAFVRKQPCCNCGSRSSVEAHHEGKKGVGQRVRDTMAVPLCTVCHAVYTQTNRLPHELTVALPKLFSGADLRARQESLDILRTEQERLLDLALAEFEQTDRIEILSKGIANIRRPVALAQLLGRFNDFHP